MNAKKKKPEPSQPLELSLEQYSAVHQYLERQGHVQLVIKNQLVQYADDEQVRRSLQVFKDMEEMMMGQLREYITSEVDIKVLPRVIDIIDRPEVNGCVLTTMLAGGYITLTNLDIWSLTTTTLDSISSMNGKGHFL